LPDLNKKPDFQKNFGIYKKAEPSGFSFFVQTGRISFSGLRPVFFTMKTSLTNPLLLG